MPKQEGSLPLEQGLGESSEGLRPEFTEDEAMSWVSRIYRMSRLAYIKFSTNGNY